MEKQNTGRIKNIHLVGIVAASIIIGTLVGSALQSINDMESQKPGASIVEPQTTSNPPKNPLSQEMKEVKPRAPSTGGGSCGGACGSPSCGAASGGSCGCGG